MVFSINEQLDMHLHHGFPNLEEICNRIDNVRKIQERNGMAYRDDSRLTWLYATSMTNEVSALDVAKELMWVDWFYQKTDYSSLLEQLIRLWAAEIRQKYRLSWSVSYEIVRQYVPEMLKVYLLRATTLPKVE